MKVRKSRVSEIMIVLAIIGILIAIAVPGFIRARAQSRMKTCQENLTKIDGAKEQWALEHNQSITVTPSFTQLSSYLHKLDPPSGCEYQINRIGSNPICSTDLPGHSLSEIGSVIVAVGGSPPAAHYGMEGASTSKLNGQMMAQASSETGSSEPFEQIRNDASERTPHRYLIKEATVYLEVDSPSQAAKVIISSLERAGGYIADMRQDGDGSGWIRARVPVEQLEPSISSLGTVGKVMSRTVKSQDVTEEFLDNDARLRNLNQTEERLLDHLKRSATLEDILLAEKEIARVRGETERIEGRQTFLINRTDFSTIEIYLSKEPTAEEIIPANTFSIAHIYSLAARDLLGFGQELLTMLIWMGVWIPVWGTGIIVCMMIYRKLRSAGDFRNGRTTEPPTEDYETWEE